MSSAKPIAVKKFLGIRNTVRPERQPWGACADALNVVLDDTHTLERREGYSYAVALEDATDVFSPIGHDALFAVASGQLFSIDDLLVPRLLQPMLNEDRYSWAEMGDRVFYAGPTDAGMISHRFTWSPLSIPVPEFWAELTVGGRAPGQYQITATYTHIESGIEGPAAPIRVLDIQEGQSFAVEAAWLEGYSANIYISGANGSVPYLDEVMPLSHEQRDAQPCPIGITALAAMDGLLYAAVYDQEHDIGFVHWSQPFWFTCWKLATDYVSVPGKVLGLAGVTGGLIILTTYGCWLWTGEALVHLADYGGVPGRPIARDIEGRPWIWTQHGLCTFDADGFHNLTEGQVSIQPGAWCTTGVIERRGGKYLHVVTDGTGVAANAYGPPLPGTAWCANLRNREVTRFSNWEFLAFGQLRGEYYGLQRAGLYAIGGDSDAGADPQHPQAIVGSFTLHPTDFGDTRLKRCTHAYVTGCDDVAVTVRVTCDGDWVGDYASQRRIVLARGPRGQFWQFSVSDIHDGPLRVTGFEIMVEPTSRRV